MNRRVIIAMILACFMMSGVAQAYEPKEMPQPKNCNGCGALCGYASWPDGYMKGEVNYCGKCLERAITWAVKQSPNIGPPSKPADGWTWTQTKLRFICNRCYGLIDGDQAVHIPQFIARDQKVVDTTYHQDCVQKEVFFKTS